MNFLFIFFSQFYTTNGFSIWDIALFTHSNKQIIQQKVHSHFPRENTDLCLVLYKREY